MCWLIKNNYFYSNKDKWMRKAVRINTSKITSRMEKSKSSVKDMLALIIAKCNRKRGNKFTSIKTSNIRIKVTDKWINRAIRMKIKRQVFQLNDLIWTSQIKAISMQTKRKKVTQAKQKKDNQNTQMLLNVLSSSRSGSNISQSSTFPLQSRIFK